MSKDRAACGCDYIGKGVLRHKEGCVHRPGSVKAKIPDGPPSMQLTQAAVGQSKQEAGLKYDGQKPDMSLIPAAAMLEEANVWTYGKEKYAAFNWHKGVSFSRILSGMERHMALLKSGLDYDYENKMHHAAAIRCACAMLIQFTLENRTDLDDRIKLTEETLEKLEKLAQGQKIGDLFK